MTDKALDGKALGKVIQIDEKQIQFHLDQKVRQTVEETLNAMLDKEAEALCGAKRYEHTEDRKDTRAGHYERKLHTQVGEVKLKVPKLRALRFETEVIQRYRRREASVEEAMIEMYLAGVSVRKVEDITEALWGTSVSPSTISALSKKVYCHIEAWRNRPIVSEYPYVYLDGIYLKRCFGGEVRNIAVLVAIGVDAQGFRHVLGIAEGTKEDLESWRNFLRYLKQRGLSGVRLFVTDKCLGLVEALGEFYPEARWQRCIVHFYRNVFTLVPTKRSKEVAAMLKAIHAQEDFQEAKRKAEAVAQRLESLRLLPAGKLVRDQIHETLSYYAFPREHWRSLRTNNPLERIMREIRRRTRVVGAFPDGQSALMLSAARLRHIESTQWSRKRYLCMEHLVEQERDSATASKSA